MGPQFNTPVSFEFFPPRDESGRDKLAVGTAEKLAALQPRYFSVTYGAEAALKKALSKQ
jgi:5,10-methylenetetrahydrofolate reductase